MNVPSEEPGGIDELNPYSPIRVWVHGTLRDLFLKAEKNEIVSTGNKKERILFYEWTGQTQQSLQKYWITHPGKKYSTCAEFLRIFVKKLCMAGQKKRVPSGFNAFGLNSCGKDKGWHEYSELGTHVYPQPGDLFQLRNEEGQTQHVGVIFDIRGRSWRMVAGGGGTIGEDQKITKTDWTAIPQNLMGWLDIEEYFEGW